MDKLSDTHKKLLMVGGVVALGLVGFGVYHFWLKEEEKPKTTKKNNNH